MKYYIFKKFESEYDLKLFRIIYKIWIRFTDIEYRNLGCQLGTNRGNAEPNVWKFSPLCSRLFYNLAFIPWRCIISRVMRCKTTTFPRRGFTTSIRKTVAWIMMWLTELTLEIYLIINIKNLFLLLLWLFCTLHVSLVWVHFLGS